MDAQPLPDGTRAAANAELVERCLGFLGVDPSDMPS